MKYEMIFGDYEFASSTCEIAIRSGYGDTLEMSLTAPIVIPDEWSVIAMRRIIKEPNRWTWEDKKAGRLPEVGAEFKARGYVWECVRILNNTILAVVGDSYCGFDIDECKPIESPEEKAARLRSEWISKAYVDFHRLGCELEALQKEQIKVIYDAMLSGELQAPKG